MKKKLFLMLLVTALGLVISGSVVAVQGASEWTLEVDGSVYAPAVLTLDDLRAMPRTIVYADLYCYGELVTSGNWGGVSLRFILENVEFNQNAMSVEFSAEDGYKIGLSIAEALREDVIIAYEKDGQVLPETLRLVLPDVNGASWIAMITRITVSMNASSPPQSATPIAINPPPTLPPSPTPQPTPTPKPTPSPSPAPSPSLTTPQSNPKPFPITWTVAAVATVTVASAGLIVYFKKRNH